MGKPGLFFVYFRSFQTQVYRKTVGVSGIRTGIVGIEGEPADYLTTNTAREGQIYILNLSLDVAFKTRVDCSILNISFYVC